MSEQKTPNWWRRMEEKDRKLVMRLGACLFLGLVLLCWSQWSQPGESSPSPPVSGEIISADAGKEDLEAKLTQILSQVKGAGAVRVAITYSESASAVYAWEQQNKASESGSGIETEQKSVLAVADSAPVVVKQESPKVQGVLVVAEGAADPLVKERLYKAVKSLLDISGERVAIIEGQITD